jgi:poly(3-hydroxybutyrate) depolymerase
MQLTIFWIKSKKIRGLMLLLLATVFAGACGSAEDAAVNEDRTAISTEGKSANRERVTVSGVSSGGYMAVQVHVALADRVSGAGIVAGGPYHCAEGSVATALGRCMSGENLDVSRLVSFTRAAASSGGVAPTEFLQDAKVWIFHGTKDAVVASTVAVALADYYAEFMPAERIVLVDDVEAVHGWPTLDAGSECLSMSGDFINACGFDTAGNLLSHLYEDLVPPATDSVAGNLKPVNFSELVESGRGLSDTGYLFVPESCEPVGSSCRLHVAFHGCRQGAEFIGDRFATLSGLNAWAAQNRIVVTYPQIESTPLNPQGCWDWWGYTGTKYDLKAGKQISAINAIINAFANGRLLP